MSETATHVALGPGAEFDTIRAIWKRLGTRTAPAGDDCAFLTVGGKQLAISTDCSVEGTHFRTGWLGPSEIGWRATMAALSDLAAVGADARGVLVGLGLNEEYPHDFAVEIMDGAGAAAAAVGAQVLGGDLFRSALITVAVTVMGEVAGAPVARSGARPGDILFVTGWLGGPGIALAAFAERREPAAAARERFARPVARVDAGRCLREAGVHAMIDISDGLIADAGHLAAAGGVRCVVDVDCLPEGPLPVDPLAAAVSGEEYELLVAAAPEARKDIARMAADLALPCTEIGSVAEGQGVETLRGGRIVAGITSFRHFE